MENVHLLKKEGIMGARAHVLPLNKKFDPVTKGQLVTYMSPVILVRKCTAGVTKAFHPLTTTQTPSFVISQ